MKTQFKYLLSNLLLVGLTGTMFASTGCPEDPACELDADCAEGEVCNTETSTCEAPSGCANDDACAAGERCLDITDGTGTCRAPANCSEQADPNGFCNTAMAGQVCEGTMCVTPAPTTELKYILILDTSSGNDACRSITMMGSLANPGSDIYQAELQNGTTGEDIGYAKYAHHVEGTSTSEPPNSLRNYMSVFDGSPADLNTGSVCPAADGANGFFSPATSVALGCGGELYLSFQNGAASAALANGQDLIIGEFTTACNDGISDGNDTPANASDVYSVFACETQIGKDPTTLTKADCTIPLGTMLKGWQSISVSGLPAN